MGIYHIGNPDEVSVRSLAEKIVRHLGREANIIPGTLPRGETPRRCPDIAKLLALGFTPRIPLDAGLPPMIDWYLSHIHLHPFRGRPGGD
jgi:dTDP-glucose 4,6-dehydratase/UDP-glucose 4-epimerase